MSAWGEGKVRIDLHAHSYVSDGTESPGKVVETAAHSGISVVALTDHDTTGGWLEAEVAARRAGIGFVPGIEISCETDDRISVHLLAYLPDENYLPLREELTRIRDSRKNRARQIVGRLSEDFDLQWEDVQQIVGAQTTVGRPHIADALVAKEVVSTRSEAFQEILRPGSKYFVGYYALRPEHAVELVLQAGGVPVLAHPAAHVRGRVISRSVVENLAEQGLAGLEIDHRDNSDEGKAWLHEVADKYGLLVTGSSDYHGLGKPNRLGENTTTPETLERIAELGSGANILWPIERKTAPIDS